MDILQVDARTSSPYKGARADGLVELSSERYPHPLSLVMCLNHSTSPLRNVLHSCKEQDQLHAAIGESRGSEHRQRAMPQFRDTDMPSNFSKPAVCPLFPIDFFSYHSPISLFYRNKVIRRHLFRLAPNQRIQPALALSRTTIQI